MRNFAFSRGLNNDLYEVDENLKSYLNNWWEEIAEYIKGVEADPLWQNIPEFVLLTYDYFGIKRDLTIKMAAIFKLVYLTKYIHGTIRDDEEGQEYNQILQFTILIGDYLSGLIMSLLLKAEMGELTDSFTDLMIDINEGLVIEHKINPSASEILEKTSASLYKTIFITAARIVNIMDKQDLAIVNLLGTQLGMVMILLNRNAPPQDISKYINEVNKLFLNLTKSKEASPTYLEMAIAELTDFYGNQKKVAAL